MTETPSMTFGQIVDAVLRLEESQRRQLAGLLMPPTGIGVEKKKPSRTKYTEIMDVSFGTLLRQAVKDNPRKPQELIEYLRENGVRLSQDNDVATQQ
jgi:hypothetical protein